MKFTKTEIDLCKQVAEKQRKEIGKGDWYIANDLILLSTSDAWVGQADIIRHTPLWTISDCLEFLRERGLRLLGLQQTDDDEYSCGFCETDDLGMRLNEETAKWADGETPLEACLKAVLAVLEESK